MSESVFIVVASIEMPLESSGFTEYWIEAGSPRARELKAARVIHYGPFASYPQAKAYAELAGGTVLELVRPVATDV